MYINIFRTIKSKFYAFIIKYTQYYCHLVDTDPKKAKDMMWYRCFKKYFPWDNPVTLNEKITWLSIMSDTSKWVEYSDKYDVRKYIKKLGLGHILTECYGIWDNVEDIDFDALPESFAIKCTHDCGSTLLIHNKNKEDINEVKKVLKEHLEKKMGYRTCEPHYTKLRPRIIAEELINFDSTLSSSIVDYKFWVINGNAKYCMLVYDRQPEELGGKYILDLYRLRPWEQAPGLISDFDSRYGRKMPEPQDLEEMINIAEKIADGFPIVRIDLYNANGKIYFGEMTFTSQGGRMSYYTPEFQEEMGMAIRIN